MPLRLDDTGTVTRVERTPQGGIRAPGILTRSGVFTYQTPSGPVREYRPPEEVFRADSLATLGAAPVTLGHPKAKGQGVKVSPDNFRDFAVGYLNGGARQDGDGVAAEVVVQDIGAIEAILAGGNRELSCGYDCRTDETPGETPEGIPFDRIQRDIVYNHVAIVSRGRAGKSVRLRLDAEDNQIPDNGGEVTTMDPKQIEALINELAAMKARVMELEKLLAGETATAETATATADAATARADAATARADATEKALVEATSLPRIDSLVGERADVLNRARALLPADFDINGKSNREIRISALVAKDKDFRSDGLSDDYVKAYFDASIKAGVSGSGDVDSVRRAAAGAKAGAGDTQTRADATEKDPADWRSARARMVADYQKAGSANLTATK